MTPTETTQEIREDLVTILRRARERGQKKEESQAGWRARWSGLTTWQVWRDLYDMRHARSQATVRRHLRALEEQGVIREVGVGGGFVWQFISDEDKARKEADANRRQEAEDLAPRLAAHLGINEDDVHVYPHRETTLHVSIDVARGLCGEAAEEDGDEQR